MLDLVHRGPVRAGEELGRRADGHELEGEPRERRDRRVLAEAVARPRSSELRAVRVGEAREVDRDLTEPRARHLAVNRWRRQRLPRDEERPAGEARRLDDLVATLILVVRERPALEGHAAAGLPGERLRRVGLARTRAGVAVALRRLLRPTAGAAAAFHVVGAAGAERGERPGRSRDRQEAQGESSTQEARKGHGSPPPSSRRRRRG